MRYEVTINGRVQGVGLRAVCKEIASDLGVVGWVRNEPDGTVMLVVEGEQATLDTMLDRVKDRMSEFISHLSHEEAPERNKYNGFEVRY